MARTTPILRVSVRNDGGGDEQVTLSAAFDETIEENIIVQQVSQQLHDYLKLESTPIYQETSLRDSVGITYTARSKVELLVRQVDGTSSGTGSFYVSHSESEPLGGGFHIILGKKWRAKFRIPNESGAVPSGAAPLVIHGSSADKKARQEEAKRRQDEARKKLKEAEEAKKAANGSAAQSASAG
ncbi:hypothetical protein BDV19DRAFT_369618 [Aspergillus venezuelensis]